MCVCVSFLRVYPLPCFLSCRRACRSLACIICLRGFPLLLPDFFRGSPVQSDVFSSSSYAAWAKATVPQSWQALFSLLQGLQFYLMPPAASSFFSSAGIAGVAGLPAAPSSTCFSAIAGVAAIPAATNFAGAAGLPAAPSLFIDCRCCAATHRCHANNSSHSCPLWNVSTPCGACGAARCGAARCGAARYIGCNSPFSLLLEKMQQTMFLRPLLHPTLLWPRPLQGLAAGRLNLVAQPTATSRQEQQRHGPELF